ncbi:MAG: winged helix-turn-helix domain-containing protein [Niabella sp.]
MQKLSIVQKEKVENLISEYFKKNDEAKFIHRLHGILLFLKDEKSTCNSVGLMFGNSPRTVSNWVKKVNKSSSLEVLRTQARTGRRSKLNDIQLAEIKEVLQKSPEESGVFANIWDGKSLSFYIEKQYQIILGVRRCQKLFHELGFGLKRARPIVAKGDELKKEVFKKTSRKTSK